MYLCHRWDRVHPAVPLLIAPAYAAMQSLTPILANAFHGDPTPCSLGRSIFGFILVEQIEDRAHDLRNQFDSFSRTVSQAIKVHDELANKGM
jgi:hypothetical protein